MQHKMRRAAGCAVIWAGMICLYTAALLLAYTIPDEWIAPGVEAAVAIIDEESNMVGGYATYFWHNGFGITDNLTDIGIYKGLLRDGRSIVDAAMRTDYPRYWHGYAVTLRPLVTVLSIINIRYLNMMALMGLFALCYWHCRRRMGGWMAAVFSIGLLMTFLLIAPFCQQYMTVTLLTLLSCWLLLAFWERLRDDLPEFFLILGSLVCFFDFLTFPVLALGYPLLVCLLLKSLDGSSTASLWKHTIGLSALWMGSYALTWLAKAIPGGLLTGQDVIGDILEQVAFRTTGTMETRADSSMEITAWIAISKNVETFFMGSNTALFAAMLAAVVLRAIRLKTTVRDWLHALPVAAVSIYPFVWYAVMKNHVRVHFWMTNKMLAVTVFALCACALCASWKNTRKGR